LRGGGSGATVDCPPIPEDLGSCAPRVGVVSTVAVSLNPPAAGFLDR
jgi:hypothetical protein